MPGPGRRPLSGWERGRLLLDCVPFVFLLVGTVFVATIWSDVTQALTGERTPLVFGAVMTVCLAITGWVSLNRLRDLASGSAVLTEDRLVRLWRPRRGPRYNRCFGDFERLGRLRMSRSEFSRAGTALDLAQLHQLGRPATGSAAVHCQVAYSPASKIAWSVQEL